MIFAQQRAPRWASSAALTPMIDVVFQLLIFFLLTLQIRAAEGEHQYSLPVGLGCPPPDGVGCIFPEIQVRLVANADGSLRQLQLGRRNLGNDDRAYAELNRQVLEIIDRPGNPLTRDIEVQLDADFELRYQEVVKAIDACTGRLDPDSKQVVRYLDKVRFIGPRPPKNG